MSGQAAAPDPVLVVPVAVQALVMVDAVTTGFRLWRFDYDALDKFSSPEPEAGGGDETSERRSAGIYLHWDLPDALRHGTGDPGETTIGYPPVPNRWLVVRLSGTDKRVATGWVVESDCPDPDSTTVYLVSKKILDAWTASGDSIRVQGASAFGPPAADGSLVACIGRAFPLAGWQERAAAATFLTAVAPGNVLFSRYEAHCANVFTFYDAMAGVADGDTVSYLVAGWFSQPSDDIMAHATPAGLSWAVGGQPEAAPATSLYQGLVLGVGWDRGAGEPPSPATSLAGTVQVGVGPTTIDAFTALVAGRLNDPAAVDLLRAFQYGLLPQLEAVNGQNLLATAVHQAAFSSRSGGLAWEIVATADDGDTGTPLTGDEAAWLLALNQAQSALDGALATLDSHRWALYALWWKWQNGLIRSQFAPLDGFDAGAYDQAVTVDLPSQLANDLQLVNAQLANVPQPVVQAGDTRQQSFERGIGDFAAKKGLGAGKVLRAVGGRRSWRSGDPVVVLSGVEPASVPDPSALLPCRLATGLVTGLRVGTVTVGAPQLGAALPALPSTGALQAAIPALLLEAFLLDPSSAASIAAATGLSAGAVRAAITGHPAASYPGEVLPALSLDPWTQQPWQPVLMEWQVGFVPIPAQTGGKDNWTFDGLDYRFAGAFGPYDGDPAAPMEVLGGISPITPEIEITFRAQLRQFIETYVAGKEDADLEALAALQADIGTWRFMS
jgi:hypothetical protein